MKNNFYVYYLRRPDKADPFEPEKGQPFYIGKGCNGCHLEHRKEAEKLKHKPGKKVIKIHVIHSLWKKGLDFKVDIVFDDLTEQEAFDTEKEAIKAYGRIDLETGCLANMTNGGEGTFGHIQPESQRKRSREANLGNTHNLGKNLSEETKDKIRQKAIGRPKSKEHREAISKAQKGKIISEETRRKTSNTLKGRKRGSPSLETIEKMRKSLTGRHLSEEHKEKMRAIGKEKGFPEKARIKGIQANTGAKRSEEAKQRMRDAAAKRSPEVWEKIFEGQRKAREKKK